MINQYNILDTSHYFDDMFDTKLWNTLNERNKSTKYDVNNVVWIPVGNSIRIFKECIKFDRCSLTYELSDQLPVGRYSDY